MSRKKKTDAPSRVSVRLFNQYGITFVITHTDGSQESILIHGSGQKNKSSSVVTVINGEQWRLIREQYGNLSVFKKNEITAAFENAVTVAEDVSDGTVYTAPAD